MLSEIAYVMFLLGFLQFIIAGLGTWTLTTTIRLQNRLTKVETMLEASIIEDVRTLKEKINKLEKRCLTTHSIHP
jgi:cytochrome oxidase assembly protein ShyY1